ncbi:MAG: NADPH-dependent ferric-chelate reductase [Candidatus Erwinia impunctatus]|nr:NADPH-dependent ferric-chelate reductase [Culicoides impunctatus]
MDRQQTTTALPRRVRNPLHFRLASVSNKVLIANAFWRIELTGDELKGFISEGFDDHIRVFFPEQSSRKITIPVVTDEGVIWPEGPRSPARDYTPLFFDSEKGRLTIDFFRHPYGIASQWAENAAIGDQLVVGGPRGSLLVPETYQSQLYFCDETGLPALKRRLSSGIASRGTFYLWCEPELAKNYLELPAEAEVFYFSPQKMDVGQISSLCSELEKRALSGDDYFVWITGESEAVKGLSDYFTVTRQCEEARIRAVAYWHKK